MKDPFLTSIQIGNIDVEQVLHKLRDGVISMNTLLGLEDVPQSEILATYQKLTQAELKELHEAHRTRDKEGFVKELIDVLVTGLYFLYRLEGKGKGIDLTYYGEASLPTTDFSADNLTPLHEAIDLFHTLDIDHDAAVEQVLMSNNSKIPRVEELAVALGMFDLSEEVDEGVLADLQISLLEKDGRYHGVTCQRVKVRNGERLIFWAASEYGIPVKKYLKAATYKEANMEGVLK